MRKRVFYTILITALLTGVLMVLLVNQALPAAAARRTETSLSQEAALFKLKMPEDNPVAYLENSATLSRITLIAPDGTVRYDSGSEADLMENHQARPEVALARQQGTGSAQRLSDTLNQQSIYYATQLNDGSVLRLAAPVKVGRVLFQDTLPWLLLGVVLATVLSLLLAGRVTKRITRAIESIDLDRPEEAVTYEELNPMLRRIAQQNKRAHEQLTALQSQQQERDALINGMSEGFLTLDQQRRVRTINQSAANLLNVSAANAIDRSITELYRRPELMAFLDELKRRGAAQATMPWQNRSYHWVANTLENNQTVVILRDVTERVEDENMRTRFTANVSHELRTPLTAICGYTEMLQNGMAKPEDQGQFLNLIGAESRRLLQLIEDILELSKLDEGYPRGRRDKLDLNTIVAQTLETYRTLAESKGVSLTYRGEPAQVVGDATLLGELVGNLVDNAIKYNRPDGQVEVTLKRGRDSVDLTVSDTGIGIEHAQQDKIFERFFRTDKSRSKQTGGTGLGLSIVKHSAEYHGATLHLDSQPGQGTSIAVRFPTEELERMAYEDN